MKTKNWGYIFKLFYEIINNETILWNINIQTYKKNLPNMARVPCICKMYQNFDLSYFLSHDFIF